MLHQHGNENAVLFPVQFTQRHARDLSNYASPIRAIMVLTFNKGKMLDLQLWENKWKLVTNFLK